jgi:hypothetical protein
VLATRSCYWLCPQTRTCAELVANAKTASRWAAPRRGEGVDVLWSRLSSTWESVNNRDSSGSIRKLRVSCAFPCEQRNCKLMSVGCGDCAMVLREIDARKRGWVESQRVPACREITLILKRASSRRSTLLQRSLCHQPKGLLVIHLMLLLLLSIFNGTR